MKRKIITDNAKRTVGKKTTVFEQLDKAFQKHDFKLAEQLIDKMDLDAGTTPEDLETRKEVIKEMARGPFLPRKQFEQKFDQLFKTRKGQKEMEKYISKSKSPIGVLGTTPANAIESYYKAKGNQSIPEPVGGQSLTNPKSYLGGQAVASGGYAPWKPGNTPNLDEMNAMLSLLGGGPIKGGADTFMASPKTYEKLKANFGPEVANDLSAIHGIKVQVVPGMPDDKMLAINQATIDKFKNEYFAKQFMQEWPPIYWEEKKEKK